MGETISAFDKPLDIIGDIHGYADQLKHLLSTLGYEFKNGTYRHAERIAVFVGDYIDRGPANLEVVDIVRAMVEAGSAYALMGNHEYNALGFHTVNPNTGETCRPQSAKNIKRHKAFLDEMAGDAQKAQDALDWFRTLPIAMKAGPAFIVHACWDHPLIEACENKLGAEMVMSEEFFYTSHDESALDYNIIDILLKGPEIDLEAYGAVCYDHEGSKWAKARIAWWPTKSNKLSDMIASVVKSDDLPEIDIDRRSIVSSQIPDDKICFFGHYWMKGSPKLLAPNIACVDYSIAHDEGILACYQWDGELELDPRKFCWTTR